jgi:hypothetical protein
MKKLIPLWLILPVICSASAEYKPIPPGEEVALVHLPVFRKYVPNPNKSWFAGSIIEIKGDRFHYRYFTDVADDDRPEVKEGLDGSVRYFASYIELTYPDGRKSYHVLSMLDGRHVLWDWAAFEQWKRSGYIKELGILFEEKTAPNQAPQTTTRTVTDRAPSSTLRASASRV